MRSNSLSALGRMSYATHLAVYPSLLGFYLYVIAPWRKSSAEAGEKAEWDSIVKAKSVDPDLFNPFTPIPYHNNPELKYVFAHVNMRNYVNKNHINTKDYVWKNYQNSFDHSNKKDYLWNWSKVE